MNHVHQSHPAVGLLAHAYADQNASNPNSPAGVCGLCGFDEPWHQLEVGDYTGAQPRPKDWHEKLERANPERAKHEGRSKPGANLDGGELRDLRSKNEELEGRAKANEKKNEELESVRDEALEMARGGLHE